MPHKSPIQDWPSGRAGVFATTQWGVILAARDGNAPAASDALELLCQTYWYPLYAYVHRRGYPPEDARDLTQHFFARLLEKNYLRSVRTGAGRFRTFLLTAMQHFLANEWIRERRLKRGGGCAILPLDGPLPENRYLLEAADHLTAERILDRRWALTILETALSSLSSECAATGKTKLFEELKHVLAGEKGEDTLAEIGVRLGMSAGAVKIALHRLRRRYGELLRAEIGRTVASPEELDEELRHLREVLRP